LPQAVERLLIESRVIRVQRRAQSKVEVVAGSRPSERYLNEAFALAKTDGLPDDVRARVVPGFCRSAIEAACATVVRRRRMADGIGHSEVEQGLLQLTSLTTWLAAAFGYTPAQGHEVTAKVRSLGGEAAVEVLRLSRRGSHEQVVGDPIQLVRGTERLVTAIEAS